MYPRRITLDHSEWRVWFRVGRPEVEPCSKVGAGSQASDDGLNELEPVGRRKGGHQEKYRDWKFG